MKDLVFQHLMPPILAALGSLAVAGLSVLTAWLARKAGNEKVAGLVTRVGHAVSVAVAHVEQTMRPQVEAALSDGSISEEEGRKLRDAALAAVKAELAPWLKDLASAFGLATEAAIDTFLTRRIEAMVLQMPATNPTPR